MKINEVETRTGMTRANIRFYEKEGLLEPRRKENGYRDYNEEDVSTLEKVKLLRRLGVSVEVIGQLQRGEAELGGVLDRQIRELDWAAEENRRARELCAAIRADGVEYSQLHPERYRERLPEPTGPIAQDVARPGHPWRRYFARMLDMLLYELACWLITVEVLQVNPIIRQTEYSLLSLLVAVAAVLLAEPLMFHLWGTTPGKWLFGITVRDVWGRKPSYWDGVVRNGRMLWSGYGFFVPIYNLCRLYRCYKACAQGEELPWEEMGQVICREDHAVPRAIGFVACQAALFALMFITGLRGYLPPNRGPITPEQYAENVAYLQKWNGYMEEYTLGSDGRWQQPGTSVYVSALSGEPADHRLTTDGGYVVAVTLVESGDGQMYVLQAKNRMLAFWALAGSRKNSSARGLLDEPVMDRLCSSSDYVFTSQGVTVAQEAEISGYYVGDSGFFLREEGAEGAFRMELKLSLEP